MATTKKVYDKEKHSKEQREALSGDAGRGIGCTFLSEPLPNFNQAECEHVIEGRNNTYIVLGRDRPGPKIVNLKPEEDDNPNLITGPYGPKGYPKCGTIDIVAGRHSVDPAPFKKVGTGTSAREMTLKHEPDFFRDAARIYISQKTDVDENFKIGNKRWIGKDYDRSSQGPGAPQSVGKSAIGMKADAIRIIGRSGIKLVTGTDSRDSLGRFISVGGIDLIAGNDDEDMQALIKGKNMLDCMSELVSQMDTLSGLVAQFLEDQTKINNAFVQHTHKSPFFGLITAPSETAVVVGRSAIISQLNKTKLGLVIFKKSLASFRTNHLTPLGQKYICSKYNRTN